MHPDRGVITLAFNLCFLCLLFFSFCRRSSSTRGQGQSTDMRVGAGSRMAWSTMHRKIVAHGNEQHETGGGAAARMLGSPEEELSESEELPLESSSESCLRTVVRTGGPQRKRSRATIKQRTWKRGAARRVQGRACVLSLSLLRGARRRAHGDHWVLASAPRMARLAPR